MARKTGLKYYLHPTYSVILSLSAALLHWRAIHTKSPQEHVIEAWWTSSTRARTQKATTVYYRPLFHPPAHRCIRVKLFSGDLSRMMDDTCLFSDFYLDDVGNLDLRLVRGRWGLDRIQIVVYSQQSGLKLIIPRNLDLLPARHVEFLKGHDDCLRIIEVPSQSAIKTRAHRVHLRELSEYASAGWTSLWIFFVFMVLAWLVYSCFHGSLPPIGFGVLNPTHGIHRLVRPLKSIDIRTLL
ncbi:hypothetical protein BC835DRAFT_441955 [Cytidiella melzeri]|nr:hypothetical protein BC835DRAFT_441955 [Cytidiella melzeri]